MIDSSLFSSVLLLLFWMFFIKNSWAFGTGSWQWRFRTWKWWWYQSKLVYKNWHSTPKCQTFLVLFPFSLLRFWINFAACICKVGLSKIFLALLLYQVSSTVAYFIASHFIAIFSSSFSLNCSIPYLPFYIKIWIIVKLIFLIWWNCGENGRIYTHTYSVGVPVQ